MVDALRDLRREDPAHQGARALEGMLLAHQQVEREDDGHHGVDGDAAHALAGDEHGRGDAAHAPELVDEGLDGLLPRAAGFGQGQGKGPLVDLVEHAAVGEPLLEALDHARRAVDDGGEGLRHLDRDDAHHEGQDPQQQHDRQQHAAGAAQLGDDLGVRRGEEELFQAPHDEVDQISDDAADDEGGQDADDDAERPHHHVELQDGQGCERCHADDGGGVLEVVRAEGCRRGLRHRLCFLSGARCNQGYPSVWVG